MCIAGYSGYRVYSIQHGYSEAKQTYNEISREYVSYSDKYSETKSVGFSTDPVAVESSPL